MLAMNLFVVGGLVWDMTPSTQLSKYPDLSDSTKLNEL